MLVYEQLLTIIIVALILGMDAFSLAIGMGLRGVSRRFELRFSSTVAVLHVLMPLLGLVLGLVVGKFLGVWATRLGALVLAYLGVDLFIKGYRGIKPQTYKLSEGKKILGLESSNNYESWAAILLLGISVSIDALTAGFSLGTLKMPVFITVAFTGLVAGSMTLLGFMGGRVFSRLMGVYAQIMGGVILFALAIKLVA